MKHVLFLSIYIAVISFVASFLVLAGDYFFLKHERALNQSVLESLSLEKE